MTEYRICNDCSEDKPLSDYYSTLKISKEKEEYIYYNPKCKECVIKRTRESQERHKEFLVEYRKARYKSKSEYYINKSKESYRKNTARHREYLREWQNKNRDKLREYRLKREFNKAHEISEREWSECKKYFDNCCAYCGVHQKNHFRMWGGEMKNIDLHREHVDHEGANDLSNCVPSCQSCNSSKRSTDFLEWYVSSPNFDSIRLNKILLWLRNDHISYLDSV